MGTYTQVKTKAKNFTLRSCILRTIRPHHEIYIDAFLQQHIVNQDHRYRRGGRVTVIREAAPTSTFALALALTIAAVLVLVPVFVPVAMRMAWA